MSWLLSKLTTTAGREPTERCETIPAPACDLWDYIVDMDWQQAMDHARLHPLDAQWMDGHWHETSLYLVCQHGNPPDEVVRAILQAYPSAVSIVNRSNRDLPIHIACRYQASYQILLDLLTVDPSTALVQSRWGKTPLEALWEFRCKEEGDEGSAEELSFWKKVVILLTAVATVRDGSVKFFSSQFNEHGELKEHLEEPPLVVHAAVSLGALNCPIEVFDYIFRMFPDQIFMFDCHGLLPLHIVVGPSAWSTTTRRKYKPRERGIIACLLDLYPEAADMPGQNEHGKRHPLHTALANRHTWEGGVDAIFFASPHVVAIPDPVTKLLPYQLAAIPVGDTVVDLDTIYNLLLANPEQVQVVKTEAPSKEYSNETVQEQPKTVEMMECDVMWRKLRMPNNTLVGSSLAIAIGIIASTLFAPYVS